MNKPKLIPRRLLFGNPEKMAPQISPDGKMLAYLAPVNGVLNLWVGRLDQFDFRPISKNKQRGVGTYFWAQDNRRILYLQDQSGDENWHLHSLDIFTGETNDLTPFAGVQVKLSEHDKHHPNDLILAMNLENPALHDLYQLDLRTNKIRKISENPGDIVAWQVDTDLKVRAAFRTNKEGGYDLIFREREDSAWQVLRSWEAEDSQTIVFETFSKDNEQIIIRDPAKGDTVKLVKIELKTGETEEIFFDPEYDLNYVMTHPDDYEVQLLSVTRERNEVYLLDPEIIDDLQNISRLNNGDYVIYDRDNSDKKWLVGFNEDNAPTSFYLYERERKKGVLLFYNKPELKNYQLARMEAFKIETDDGFALNGYITFPPGKKRENLPLVLNVHGGPWQRDTWGFNSEAQWLANRGYICLQVNFRGSVGYGKKFLNAGNKEWGGKMQDDLFTALNWAISLGYADPQRIAIYGMSYGGYAALTATTFNPDFFRCAIAVSAPPNLLSMIKNIPPYWQAHLDNLKKRVGDPETEFDFLKSQSPLFYAEKIKTPLLIVHGANDPRVKKSEAEELAKVLREKNIYHELLIFPDEGHCLGKPENRFKFYSTAENFLASFLGGEKEEEELEIKKIKDFGDSIFD